MDNQEAISGFEDTFEDDNILIRPYCKGNEKRAWITVTLNELRFITNDYAFSAFSAMHGEPERPSWANCV